MNAGNLDVALSLFRRALALDNDPTYRRNMAVVYYRYAHRDIDAAMAAQDASRLATGEQWLAEGDRLGGRELDANYSASVRAEIREFRQELARAGARQGVHDQVDRLIQEANAARQAGQPARELDLVRQAQRLAPNDPALRANVMRALVWPGAERARLAVLYGDASVLADLQRDLDEVEALDGPDFTSVTDYRAIVEKANSLRSNLSRLRQVSQAHGATASIAHDARESLERQRRQPTAGGLAFGDPSVVDGRTTNEQVLVRTNPVPSNAALGPARQGAVPASSAYEQAVIAGTGAALTSRVVDGGSSGGDQAATGTLVVVPTPEGAPVLSAEQLAWYNNIPAFRDANRNLEQARRAHETARIARENLDRQIAATDGIARDRLVISLSDARMAEQAARGARAEAERERARILREIPGPPIIRPRRQPGSR